MKSGPLATETLIQLLIATKLPVTDRETAREFHHDDEPVTITREPDFTFTLAFVCGKTMRLSYEAGSQLAKMLQST